MQAHSLSRTQQLRGSLDEQLGAAGPTCHSGLYPPHTGSVEGWPGGRPLSASRPLVAGEDQYISGRAPLSLSPPPLCRSVTRSLLRKYFGLIFSLYLTKITGRRDPANNPLVLSPPCSLKCLFSVCFF